ncbi:MAG: S8 family peptidase [Ignavibacteriaceae bacterium]
MKRVGLLFFLIILSVSLFAQDYSRKFTDGLNYETSKVSDNDSVLVWVFFKDKGKSLRKYFEDPSLVVSEASLERRSHVIKNGSLIDQTDLPVNRDYIKQIQKFGVKVKNATKWFNGVSGYVLKRNLDKIAALSFVKKVDFVGRYINNVKPIIGENNNLRSNSFLNKNSIVAHTYDYGQSLAELEQIKVPEVHDLGKTGTGVIICLMDAGVSNLQHEVFQNIHILDQYDFVNHDSVVANQADSGDGSHGTWTLALIGGFKSGQLVGPAFDATYLLAKTENTQSESSIEEDNWIAAAEWADSLGAQVTSTSLGYRYDFTSGTGYTAQDMNGHTAIITLGAEMAVRKGIVVVNSAGNDGDKVDQNTLNAPADGDSVIAVGAVNVSGTRASFSSYGPTADGRIKPDVMADGVDNYIPIGTPGNTSGYFSGVYSGTSFSCPLVAGVAALILEAHPNWTPMEVRDALRNTASQSSSPDSLYGWGIINAQAAIDYSPTAIDNNKGNKNKKNNIPDNYELAQNFPNPFNPSTTIKYEIKEGGYVTLNVYNLLGNLVATLVDENEPAGTYYVSFNSNSEKNPLPSGVYFYRLHVGDFVATKKMVIMK